MSYDLMVFEKTVAPKNRQDFMKWYEVQTEWNEDHGYSDPAITSNDLKNWFDEIIKKIPPMDGPLAPSDEKLDEMEENGNDSYITSYSIGKDIIYAAFSWSLVEEVFETVKRLAKEYDVGFFDVSSNDGEIIFPAGTII